MRFIFIFTFQLLLNFPVGVFSKYNEQYCDKAIFYKPYVRFFNGIGGDLIFEATSGFRTLQSSSNMYMCINGPALFYTNILTSENGERVFSDPIFGNFIHKCSYINDERSTRQVPSPTNGIPVCNVNAGGLNITGNTATASGDSSGVTTKIPQTVFDFSVKVWGVFLLGNEEDYRLSKVIFFFDTNYQTHTDLVFSSHNNGPPPRKSTKAFGLSIISIGNQTNCVQWPGGARELAYPKISGAHHASICFRTQEATDNFGNITNIHSLESRGIGDISCGPNNTNHLMLTNCTEFPRLKDECSHRVPDINMTCKTVRIIIGLDVPKYPDSLKWQSEVLEIVDEIFLKVCPEISRHFLAAVGSLTNYYVANAVSTGSNPPSEIRRPFWTFIIDALKECRDHVRPLKFVKTPFKSISQYKKDIQFINETSGTDTVNTPLFFFSERSEHDYQFNHVVEMEWITFATVLGICPRFYASKTASISSRMYTMLSEDFLDPLATLWVNPVHNQIYELLLGQYFNDEVHVKALSCLEASYVQSNTVAYRFQRPLVMNCGKYDNFFLQLPPPEFYSMRA